MRCALSAGLSLPAAATTPPALSGLGLTPPPLAILPRSATLRRLDAVLTPLFIRRRDAIVLVTASGVSPSSSSSSLSSSSSSPDLFPPSSPSLLLWSASSAESLDRAGARLVGRADSGAG